MEDWPTVDTFRTGFLEDEYRFIWEVENLQAVLDAPRPSDGALDALTPNEKVTFSTGHKIGFVSKWEVYMERETSCPHHRHHNSKADWLTHTAHRVISDDDTGSGKKSDRVKFLQAIFEIERAEGCVVEQTKDSIQFNYEGAWHAPITLRLFRSDATSNQRLRENGGRVKLLLKFKLLVGWSEENLEPLEEAERRSFLDNIAGLSLSDTCDVEIRVGGSDPHDILGAHRAILSARSPVFAKMFESGMKEAVTGVIEIGDLSRKAVEVLLHFVYNGTLHKDWGDVVGEVAYAADKYELPGLISFVNQRMINLCNSDNAKELLEVATMFQGLGKAKSDIENFLRKQQR